MIGNAARRRLLIGLLLVLLPVSIGLALLVGPVDMSLLTAWQQIDSSDAIVLWHIRIPRLLLGLLVGAGLAVCGAVMQGLFRNPLADPGLIGISSGAALGAALAIVLGHRLLGDTPLQAWLTPLASFVMGSLVTLLVYQIASQQGKTQVATLLLAGIAMQAIAGAAVGLLTYLADDAQLRDLTFWSMGGLGGAQWQTVGVTACLLLPTTALLLTQARGLNAMLLGEAEAEHLGICVERLKQWCIILTALLVGGAVSAAGMIGFVGLVVPHLIRLLVGADHRFLIPASAVLGACLLVLADVAARMIISPAELPIGILTALLGGPFFIYLLLHQRQRIHL